MCSSYLVIFSRLKLYNLFKLVVIFHNTSFLINHFNIFMLYFCKIFSYIAFMYYFKIVFTYLKLFVIQTWLCKAKFIKHNITNKHEITDCNENQW